MRKTFRAVSITVVPEAVRLDDSGWSEMERGVEQALALQPPARRRQVRLFIRAVDWLPVLCWGRRFCSLDPTRRARVLAVLQEVPLLLLRRGVWGLRTLVMLGWYTDPAVVAADRLPRLGRRDGKRADEGGARCDVAIVGSGAGGGHGGGGAGAAGARGQARAGAGAGPRFRDDDFTGGELRDGGALYADEGGFLTATGP